MTPLQQLQARTVAKAEAEVERLFPQAIRRWQQLCPALRLRKLAALKRLLAGEVRRGQR